MVTDISLIDSIILVILFYLSLKGLKYLNIVTRYISVNVLTYKLYSCDPVTSLVTSLFLRVLFYLINLRVC